MTIFNFKKTIIFFLFFSIYWLKIGFSTPIEGPIMPKDGKWHYGFLFNVVENQEIDFVDGNTKSINYFLNMSFGITDYLAFDTKMGVGNVRYDRDIGERFEYGNGFAGAYGLRVKTYKDEDKGIKLILGAHHICVHADSIRDSQGLKQEVIWDDWQLDSVIFKEFGRFIPFIGLKAKEATLIRRISGNTVRMTSKIQFGTAIGFTYKIKDNVVFNAEMRFIDEEAYSVGLMYCF